MLPDRDFTLLEKQINYQFHDHKLLQQVFVHRSALNEYREVELDNNERLEFLGDAVLELIVTEYLYRHHYKPEGELTNWRSALVRGQHLAERANDLNFGDYLYLSRGEAKSGGKAKQLILANAFEALIGALYLDGGYENAHQFVQQYILSQLDEILEKGGHVDPKSRLQEVTQENEGITPTYQVLEESGPDHNKMFLVGVYLGDSKIGEGKGPSKQAAQVQAAAAGLATLQKLGRA